MVSGSEYFMLWSLPQSPTKYLMRAQIMRMEFFNNHRRSPLCGCQICFLTFEGCGLFFSYNVIDVR